MRIILHFIQRRPAIIGCILSVLLLFYQQPAQAGRPMVIDDADIVDTGTCQLEIWADRHKDSVEYWAMPACNIAGQWELSLGGAWQDNRHQANGRAFEVQAKMPIFKEVSEHFAIAIAAAYEHQYDNSKSSPTWSLNIPLSLFLGSDKLAWHNNIGTSFEQNERHWQLNWGTGLEYDLTARASAYVEVFSESGERPWFQLAGGYWLKPEQVQLTLGVADKLSANRTSRWFSLGLNWVGFSLF